VSSDEELLLQYELMHPRVILRISRLTLFSRLACKAPSQLVNLLCDMSSLDSGWARSVISDFSWLSLCEDFPSLGDMGFGACFDYAKSNAKVFKRLVRKFQDFALPIFLLKPMPPPKTLPVMPPLVTSVLSVIVLSGLSRN
jgi:hypothetical protein